eukprot:m.102726 g.102726  ORF g.102726 m.102726 type:complete len:233 (-) comp13783_c0_seq6:185-883(-)
MRPMPLLYGGLALGTIIRGVSRGWVTSPLGVGLFLVLPTSISLTVLGITPVVFQSVLARVLHFPDDVVWWIFGSRPFNYDVIEKGVVLGRLPRSLEDVKELKDKASVSAIVTFNEPWETYLKPEDIKASGIRSLVLPTPDYNAPNLNDLKRAVEFMVQEIDSGGTVYVHCNGGKGRSSVATISYLMQVKGWSKEESYKFVKSKRKIANMKKFGGIMPQWRALKAFELSLKSE